MARALWRGAISFGLVTIPVALYPAKNLRGSLAFHMLHKGDLSRVHNKWVDELNHEVPFEEIVKGYEYEKDQYVVVGQADFSMAAVEATQSIDIMHFVDGSEIDIAYYDTPYYTEPTKAGHKAYALLRQTLKTTGKVGIGKIVIRERQHLCAVIADGLALLAYTLRWPYQLRESSDLDLPGEDLGSLPVTPQEFDMAEQLIGAMTTQWSPEQYRDTYRDDLLKLISERGRTGQLTEPPATLTREPRGSNVVDIMSLLKRSMERQKAAQAAQTRQAEGSRAPARKGRKRAAQPEEAG